jgi:hypothetical protein
VPGPVGDDATGNVAGAHHYLAPVDQGADEVGQRLGLVGQVGVHLHTGIEPVVEAPSEAGPVGATEPGLVVAAEELDVADLLAQRLGDLGRAVGAAVIDHQHRGRRDGVPDPPQDAVDVLGLVVGG